MRAIEKLLGMPAVTIQDGQRLGTLEGVEIDPAAARIAYLRLHRPDRREPALLPWEAVQSVGADVILVASEAAMQREIPETQRAHLTPHVGDRPVVTVSGDKLGTISSYDVDEATGGILRYRVRGLLSGLFGSSVTFPATAIHTFGRDAILVDDSVAPGGPHPDEDEDMEPQLLEGEGIGSERARNRNPTL